VIEFLRQPAMLGLLMVVTFMTLIMTKKMSAVTALLIVPIAFGLLAGADLSGRTTVMRNRSGDSIIRMKPPLSILHG